MASFPRILLAEIIVFGLLQCSVPRVIPQCSDRTISFISQRRNRHPNLSSCFLTMLLVNKNRHLATTTDRRVALPLGLRPKRLTPRMKDGHHKSIESEGLDQTVLPERLSKIAAWLAASPDPKTASLRLIELGDETFCDHEVNNTGPALHRVPGCTSVVEVGVEIRNVDGTQSIKIRGSADARLARWRSQPPTRPGIP
jgi:hypothetical protein